MRRLACGVRRSCLTTFIAPVFARLGETSWQRLREMDSHYQESTVADVKRKHSLRVLRNNQSYFENQRVSFNYKTGEIVHHIGPTYYPGAAAGQSIKCCPYCDGGNLAHQRSKERE